MNGKDILSVAEIVSNEKGVPREVVLEALEAAIAAAIRKESGAGGNIDVRVAIDRESGDCQGFRRWKIVEPAMFETGPESGEAGEGEEEREEFDPDLHIMLEDARVRNPLAQPGEYIEEPIDTKPGMRIGAQAAKQVIYQKVREAERAQTIAQYQHRVGEMISGVVKRVERGNVILDLGSNVEAIIARDELVPREAVRANDRLRGYLRAVGTESRGPQLVVSRTAPELLKLLFAVEVPEISEGLVEIMAAARDPGSRAKIAVRARDPRIDPIGACVGMRGSRVQSVSNELAGERVDIVPWQENPAQFVINAMQPASVVSIVVDEEAHSMDIAVAEESLSQAIGRGGQNVRLASQLTGWTLNVMSEQQAEEKGEAEAKALTQMFMDDLRVDENVAAILVQEGFSSLDEVAWVPENELLAIEEFDEEIVRKLRDRAQDVLLTREIESEEKLEDAAPQQDLLEVEGMDKTLALELASHGIVTQQDLADQAVDDLVDIGVDEARAAALIMAARAPLFARESTA